MTQSLRHISEYCGGFKSLLIHCKLIGSCHTGIIHQDRMLYEYSVCHNKLIISWGSLDCFTSPHSSWSYLSLNHSLANNNFSTLMYVKGVINYNLYILLWISWKLMVIPDEELVPGTFYRFFKVLLFGFCSFIRDIFQLVWYVCRNI